MTRRIITIDIETLPVNEPFESKLFWETEEEYRKTACDAALGRILCIGYSEQDAGGAIVRHGCFGWRELTRDFEPDERVILAEFWQYLEGFNLARDIIIGHNILDFDLPFIVQRSIVSGVVPSVDFYFGRYRRAPIFDTMRVWDCWKWKDSTSLKKLAFAYCEGRFEEIYRYCMRDVKVTRNVWRKMNFTYPAEKSNVMALAV
jgi:hypothetical protein